MLRDWRRAILRRVARESTDSDDWGQDEDYIQLSKITKIVRKDGNLSKLPFVRNTRMISWSSSESDSDSSSSEEEARETRKGEKRKKSSKKRRQEKKKKKKE